MIRAQQLRLDARLSLSQLEVETGVSRKTIDRLERTEQAGSYKVLVALAERFDVAPEDLLVPVGPIDTSEAAA